MKALYDFEPKYCPNCGAPAAQRRERGGVWNFRLRNAMTCECGVTFQKVSTEALNRASLESEGSLYQVKDDKTMRREFKAS